MELEIIRIMKQSAGTLFSYKDIGKMVNRSEFRENAHWARPLLEKMVFEKQILKEGTHYVFPTSEQVQAARQADRRGQHSAR